MGRQSTVRDLIVQLLDGLLVPLPPDGLTSAKVHAVAAQPGVANPWDAWPVWDFTEVGGFTGELLTTHWAVFVVAPSGDRLGLVEAGDLIAETIGPHLAARLSAQIERVEPLQLTFEAGGVAPVVRIALTV